MEGTSSNLLVRVLPHEHPQGVCRMRPGGSHFKHQAMRRFEVILDTDQERHRFFAIH